MSAGSSPPCSTSLLWLARLLLLQLCSWHLGLVGLQSSSQCVLGRLWAGKFSSVQEKRRIMGRPRDEYCLSVTGELKEHGSCSHKVKTARSWLLSKKKTKKNQTTYWGNCPSPSLNPQTHLHMQKSAMTALGLCEQGSMNSLKQTLVELAQLVVFQKDYN